ncbi:MAG: EAL domain-containing protein [Hoeflea sp.]|uniref:putative bifunctional diguanylate cyclase/phosphodiesterase n=1 Tax=Hoeflea sp. TaxID=1940281 RepID=UPI0032EB263F
MTVFMLATVSALTSLSYLFIRQSLLAAPDASLKRLELSGLLFNLLMYFNVLINLLVSFEQPKLVYFSIMAVIFSTTGITLRVTLSTVLLSLASLYLFALKLPDELFGQYVSIGIATAFASISMTTLLRQAILRQIDARLLADELAAKAQSLADTDMLTGIPNRRAMFDKIDYLVQQRRPFWMGIIDLDGFKGINDVYGHVIGDRLLRAVVERARAMDTEGATFGRIGGDEFIAILPGTIGEDEVREIGDRSIETISEPYTVESLDLSVGASAGFAHFPSMGSSSAQLYEKADFALYKAKSQFRGQCIVFDTAEDKEMKQAIAIERELRESNLEEELYLLFQPQYSPCMKRVVGFEALARWQNANLGLVRPDHFIRAAERAGHIRKVTDILFSKGLAELSNWPGDISLSFNLSGQDISNQAFIMSLLGKIMASGVSPARLEFEITETAVMSDLEISKAVLETLRASGCKIALDDFGSGYSSFEYLDQLPLDKVKVDRSFVRKVAHSETSREIVAGLIGLCRKLDLRCVLEGVETESEMAILTPMEPDLIQGYLFGKPMPAHEARKLVLDQDNVEFEERATAPHSA